MMALRQVLQQHLAGLTDDLSMLGRFNQAFQVGLSPWQQLGVFWDQYVDLEEGAFIVKFEREDSP